LETGRAIDADDALSDPRTEEFAEDYLKPYGIVSMLDAAVRVSGEIVGVVCCEHVGSMVKKWFGAEVHFVAEVADQVAHVILSNERNKAIEELKESEKRFRMMADSAPVMIWVSGEDALCNFFNKQWLDFVGRGLEQELGKGWIQGVHEKDLEMCIEKYLKAFKAREEFEVQYRLKRKDGVFRWVLSKGIPRYTPEGSFQGYIGTCIDITDSKEKQRLEREKVQEKLEQSEEYNRMLFELAPMGLALCTMEGKLVDLNPAYAKIIGRTVDETLGLTYWEITPKKYESQEEKMLENLNTKGVYGPYEKEYIHKDGYLVPVRLSGMILERDGQRYIWSAVQNITEAKKYSEALQDSRLLLQSQKEALEQKNAALREILEQIEIEKKQIKEDVVSNVEALLMPSLRKLRRKGSRLDLKNIKVLENNIKDLTAPFGSKVSDKKWKLTPREIEICNLIKNGLSSKEISKMLNVSFRTVEIHRNNIRKKLEINKKNINLAAYLQSF
ncbi:MAG: PAS domain S-box protein, partial [Candidatus Omnitrophica bacterium]|nr:PAS domain S-box protein [Candidatus Omnitrophota bacterium]